jgi:hypothetical protein
MNGKSNGWIGWMSVRNFAEECAPGMICDRMAVRKLLLLRICVFHPLFVCAHATDEYVSNFPRLVPQKGFWAR